MRVCVCVCVCVCVPGWIFASLSLKLYLVHRELKLHEVPLALLQVTIESELLIELEETQQRIGLQMNTTDSTSEPHVQGHHKPYPQTDMHACTVLYIITCTLHASP